MSSIVGRGISAIINPQSIRLAADSLLDQFRCKYFQSVPCGPFEESVAEAGEFVLSADTADELEAREDDFLVRADGQSMEGVGIMDDFLVLMRPLPEGRMPRTGEIALVQMITPDGIAKGTIKHWHNGVKPHLTDGAGEKVELPEATESLLPLAVARGVVGRL